MKEKRERRPLLEKVAAVSRLNAMANATQNRAKKQPAAVGNGRLAEPAELLDRMPPADVQTERSLISCLLIDGAAGGSKFAEVVEVLQSADDFHAPDCRRVYEAMLGLHRDGKPADPLLLHDVLVHSGALGDVGVSAALAEFADIMPTADNSLYFARQIADKALMRRLREAGQDFIRIAHDGGRQGAQAAITEARATFELAVRHHATVATGQRAINAAELLNMELPIGKLIVPGILGVGLTILASRPKIGKSWLMMATSAAKSTGGMVLGRIRVEPADVLYLALEDSLRRLQDRLRKILSTPGSRTPDRLEFRTEFPRLNEGGLEEIERWLDAHPAADLVVIDTLAKVKSKRKRGSDAYDEDYAELSQIQRVANDRRIAIVAVHHRRKAESSDPLDGVLGSTGLTGASDGILSLQRERGRADASLFVTHRDIEEHELALSFDRENCLWNIVGEAANFRISNERQQILDVLSTVAPNSLRPVDVAKALGKNDAKSMAAVRRLMLSMADDGEIIAPGYGRYSLKETDHTDHTFPSGSQSQSEL